MSRRGLASQINLIAFPYCALDMNGIISFPERGLLPKLLRTLPKYLNRIKFRKPKNLRSFLDLISSGVSTILREFNFANEPEKQLKLAIFGKNREF